MIFKQYYLGCLSHVSYLIGDQATGRRDDRGRLRRRTRQPVGRARSLRAAALLVENGFDVHNLNGGMRAWSVAELAVVTPEGTTGDVI